MFSSRPRFIWLLAIAIFIIPVGCEDDRPPRVDNVENTTSPSQLGEWMEQLRAIIRATNLSGPETSRVLAYASIAYYEGYALSDPEMRSLVGQLQGLDYIPSPSPDLKYNYGVIAEAAMSTVLLHQFEDASTNIKHVISSTYQDHERDYLIIGVVEPVIDRSRALGQLIGSAINTWSNADGYGAVMNCTVTMPTGEQYWVPTPSSFSPPELPCWGDLRPFTFTSEQLTQLCNPGMAAAFSTVSGSVYMTDMEELDETSQALSTEQQDVAKFWSDGPGTFTVPGHYISILNQLIDRNLLDGKATVTAWAQLSIAMADTYISTYKLKYTHNRVRPLTFIQSNMNNNWESYVTNPSTPEFPSLRATMAYAASQVFINLYGDIDFKDNTHLILSLEEREYASFTEMAQEAAFSRIYAGTNLRSSLVLSEYHGRCIAQRANELFFTQ